MRKSLTLPAVVALVVAIAACGDDGGSGGDDSSDGGSAPTALTNVLQALPNDPELLREIDYVDFAAIRKAAGLGSIDADDREGISDFTRATRLIGVPAPASAKLFQRFQQSVDVGLDPFTIDTEVSVGGGPIAVADLAMDVDTDTFNEIADDLAPEEDGIREFDLDPRNDLSRLLLGVNVLAAEDDRLVMGSAEHSALVKAVADRDEVENPLADNADLTALQDRLGAHQRLFVTSEFAEVPEGMPVAGEPVEPVLAGLGLDLGDESGETVDATAVVLFPDEASARAAATWYTSVIESSNSPNGDRPYSELIGDVDITTDGPAVIARWTGSTPPIDLVFRRDLPFLWTG